MVRAKMKVIAFEEDNSPVQEGQQRNKTLVMQSVTDGSEENKQFSQFTPAGQLHLTVTPKTEVYGMDFLVGSECYVDIYHITAPIEGKSSEGGEGKED